MKNVRIGIVGLGNMGASHATNILAGKIPRLELTAVSDFDIKRCDRFPQVKAFATAEELMDSGLIDAVIIATPHYQHTTLGIYALKAGLHVMVEKPVSVHKADALRLNAAHKNKKQVFAAMFNQRTDLYYQKIRNLIRSGELGEIRRVNWTGEGGGVLLNQCPHNLDLFQWMFGLPKRVRAHCGFGKYHAIEVEDDVTAYFEFGNGATGVFITSTGEAPGTNRLEITAERGKIVYEDDKISYTRNETPMTEFSRTTTGAFARPDTWDVAISAANHGGQHNEILKNFTEAILDGAPLVSPANEGIHSVELANAMLLSAWTDETIALPLDAARYEKLLQQKIDESARRKPKKKKVVATTGDDFSKSFGK